MKNKVEACIIILNWNGLEDTKKCLGSLLKITRPSHKIIVIDNGSSNNELQIIERDFRGKIDIYGLHKNIGFSGGMNFGIKKAIEKYDPEFFLLLNNDTIVDKNFLTELLKTSQSREEIGIVSPVIFDLEDKKKILFSGGHINWFLARPVHEKISITDRKTVGFLTGCSLLIKRGLIENIGLFDDRFFAYFEDVALSLKAIKNGYKCVVDPNAIVYHKESSSLGKKSNLYTYLFSRNRIIFVNNYTPLYYRFYFFFFNLSKLLAVELFFLMTNQTSRCYAFLKGYLDGYEGKYGAPPKL